MARCFVFLVDVDFVLVDLRCEELLVILIVGDMTRSNCVSGFSS